MIYQIEFGALATILLDFVDSREGFLYLRLVGAEAAVNAIWAKLSARNSRGQKWNSPVRIPMPGQSHPQYVAAEKRIQYRTLRARLATGMIDLAMIHPRLTVAEDDERGFYLLTYDDGIPSGFFERLNHSLALPLKPDWAEWLWTQGQQPQSFWTLQTEPVWEGGQRLDKTTLVEVTEIPITRLDSLGETSCYRVRCSGQSTEAWLEIIRRELALGIRLTKVPQGREPERYVNGVWTIEATKEGWELRRDDEIVAQGPSLNYLLAEARQSLGLHFIVERD